MLGKIDTSKRREIGELALTIGVAYAAAGVHEVGGNNRGDEVEFFQRLCGAAPGDPWCACFVCACLVKGYARAGSLAEDRTALSGYVPTVSGGLIAVTASCIVLKESALSRGLWRGRSYSPIAGDLVLFDFWGAGEPHHIGLVRSVVGSDGLLSTVEGNTSSGESGSQSEGGGVFLRRRRVDHVFGYVRW